MRRMPPPKQPIVFSATYQDGLSVSLVKTGEAGTEPALSMDGLLQPQRRPEERFYERSHHCLGGVADNLSRTQVQTNDFWANNSSQHSGMVSSSVSRNGMMWPFPS